MRHVREGMSYFFMQSYLVLNKMILFLLKVIHESDEGFYFVSKFFSMGEFIQNKLLM